MNLDNFHGPLLPPVNPMFSKEFRNIPGIITGKIDISFALRSFCLNLGSDGNIHAVRKYPLGDDLARKGSTTVVVIHIVQISGFELGR